MTVYVRCIYNRAAHKGGHGHVFENKSITFNKYLHPLFCVARVCMSFKSADQMSSISNTKTLRCLNLCLIGLCSFSASSYPSPNLYFTTITPFVNIQLEIRSNLNLYYSVHLNAQHCFICIVSTSYAFVSFFVSKIMSHTSSTLFIGFEKSLGVLSRYNLLLKFVLGPHQLYLLPANVFS